MSVPDENASRGWRSDCRLGRTARMAGRMVVIAVFVIGSTVALGAASRPPERIQLACDWAVETALTSSDMIELQRADYLTRHLRRAVGKRTTAGLVDQLPPPPRGKRAVEFLSRASRGFSSAPWWVRTQGTDGPPCCSACSKSR